MNPCKDIHDKIIFYDDLSRSEQQAIKQHIGSCSDCRKQFREMQTITVGLKQSVSASHIDDDLLTRYGIYRSDPDGPDYDGRQLTGDEIAGVENHLETCRICAQKVEQIEHEFREIDAFLERAGVPALQLKAASPTPRVAVRIARLGHTIISGAKTFFSLPKLQLYPVAAVACAAVVALIWISPFFRSNEYPYLKLAAIDAKSASIGGFVRGDADMLLSDGLYAFDQGQYEIAIERLQRFIDEHPDNPNWFYAHYLSGVANLSLAKSDFLGRFHDVEPERVDRAIGHLQVAVQTTDNLRVQENAYWFIGKAHLMLQHSEQAKSAFQKVIAMQGERADAARQMISEMAKSQIN